MYTNKRPSKRVRFSPDYHVQEIEPAEKRDSWYSSQEMACFQETAKLICQQIEELSLEPELEPTFATCVGQDEHSIRGLEIVGDPHLSRFRKRQRTRVIQGVLIAQETARDNREDLEDVERFIAFFSQKESAKSQRFAEMMGKADASAIPNDGQHLRMQPYVL